jgi:ABC-2 type transport system ATP-binding protein
LLEPSSGTATVLGMPPHRFGSRERRRLGYMPQSFSLYPTLTVLENTRFMASLYGLGWLARGRRMREVLQFLELWDARNRLGQDLSGGMQRRLSLAGAILHSPGILVVDEPTAGLDPVLRLRIWDYLQDLREKGTSIIVTTQYIEEAERCDHVAILSGGKVAGHGSPLQLREQANIPDTIELDVDQPVGPQVTANIRALAGVRSLLLDDDRRRLILRVEDFATVLPEIQAELSRAACSSTVASSRQATFEEVFMRHTGQA